MAAAADVKFRRGEGLPAVGKWSGGTRGSPVIDLRREPGSEVVKGGVLAYRGSGGDVKLYSDRRARESRMASRSHSTSLPREGENC